MGSGTSSVNETLAFEERCKTQHPTCTKKYGFVRIDGATYRCVAFYDVLIDAYPLKNTVIC